MPVDDLVHHQPLVAAASASSCRRARAATAPRRRRGDRRSARSAGRRRRRRSRTVVVGDRDRLAVRDQEAVERPLQRRPGAHAGAGAGPLEIDRAPQPKSWRPPSGRKCRSCVPQPSSAGWQPSPTKPSIDQVLTNSPGRFGCSGHLRVALGDVDHLDAELARQRGPLRPRSAGDHRDRRPVSRGDVQQRLLDEVRDQAGIGAVRDHRRRAAGAGLAAPARSRAARSSSAATACSVGIGVAARPRARCRCRDRARRAPGTSSISADRRDVDRQVEQEVARAQQRLEHSPVILARQRLDDEARRRGFGHVAAALLGGDDAMRSASMSIWRRISGSTPWPMLPKPTHDEAAGEIRRVSFRNS